MPGQVRNMMGKELVMPTWKALKTSCGKWIDKYAKLQLERICSDAGKRKRGSHFGELNIAARMIDYEFGWEMLYRNTFDNEHMLCMLFADDSAVCRKN